MSNWYKSLAIAMLAGLFGSQVVQAQAPTSSPANPTEERPSPVVPEEILLEPTPNEISCPPGQFPSAFSDVSPDDWAYEAVIQLASPPIKCFSSAPEQ